MPAPFRIATAGLSAEVSAVGAELVRLAGPDGSDYLWSGDPAWWNGRAPILFPIVGTLNADCFRWHGERYQLPRHGFARRRDFALIEHGAARLRLRLEADDATRAMWPFDFRLDMIFAIQGARLSMVAEVTNRSAEAMPTSFGFHPALPWPLPGAEAKVGHAIRFDKPESAPIRLLDKDGLLDPKPRETPVVGDTLMLDDGLFSDDALIFDRIESRGLTYGAPGSARIDVDFADMPHLGLWMKPGAGYLCVEPWQGHSDPQGFAGSLDEKPGMVGIAPGETRCFGMGITIS